LTLLKEINVIDKNIKAIELGKAMELMTGYSHKQTRKSLHKPLDTLLTEKEIPKLKAIFKDALTKLEQLEEKKNKTK
jgi:hypothetical protein